MTNSDHEHDSLRTEYKRRHGTVLVPLADSLRAFLINCLEGEPRIDRIAARAKEIDKFVVKATKLVSGRPKYEEPFEQIQDQVGARIITFYPSDVVRLDPIVKRWFNPIEIKNHIPESHWEFGYFGHHYILAVPSDVIDPAWDGGIVPRFFELQIKTLFQHAWSEANHDLGYKPSEQQLTADQTRSLAYTSAQAWGADRMFDELFHARNAPTPAAA
jgi:putative GTP pyrophosphokinase